MVVEERPERGTKQSEPAMNAKEEGSTIRRDTERAMIRRMREGSIQEKGRPGEGGREVQEEMKEVGDSVHTGEKNLMPSMLKRGWGRIPLLLSMGNAREYERNKLPHSSAAENKLEKKRDTARPVKKRNSIQKNSGKKVRDIRRTKRKKGTTSE